MKKVILFGATGHLGKAIAKELVRQEYQLTIVARSKEKAEKLSASLPATSLLTLFAKSRSAEFVRARKSSFPRLVKVCL